MKLDNDEKNVLLSTPESHIVNVFLFPFDIDPLPREYEVDNGVDDHIGHHNVCDRMVEGGSLQIHGQEHRANGQKEGSVTAKPVTPVEDPSGRMKNVWCEQPSYVMLS